MCRIVRILVLAGLLAVILIAPASPTLGQAPDPLVACAEIAFSTEEDFVTQGPTPPDGNPLISDGDLLGHGCTVCRRNAELLENFDVREDLGLDAADIINVDAGLVAFSTELDSPYGDFTAGDLLTTHGAVIPNVALLHRFDLPMADLGLDAVHFVGDLQGINAFLDYAREVSREEWFKDPGMLGGMLEEFKIDILFSTEGTAPWPKDPLFLDGDLLSARDGIIVAANHQLLPAAVPAGIPDRGVDFGLDAATTNRAGERELIHFSTEILFTGQVPFTDGDVLKLGNGVILTNNDLTGCFEPHADDLGLDALFMNLEKAEPGGSRGLRAPALPSLPPAIQGPNTSPAVPSLEQEVQATANGEDGIVLYNLLTADSETVSTAPYRWQMTPAVYGDRIVWADKRNDNWDIYMYDYGLGIEIQITSDTNDQTQPAIYDDKIVYISNQSGNDDVYMFNVTSWTETPICTDAAYQLSPDIY
ncbi:MAG: hypothetical protein PVI07_10595, partial [Anaerolineae bacterium]